MRTRNSDRRMTIQTILTILGEKNIENIATKGPYAFENELNRHILICNTHRACCTLRHHNMSKHSQYYWITSLMRVGERERESKEFVSFNFYHSQTIYPYLYACLLIRFLLADTAWPKEFRLDSPCSGLF